VPFHRRPRLTDHHFLDERYEMERQYLMLTGLRDAHVNTISRISVVSDQELELMLESNLGTIFFTLSGPSLKLLAVNPGDQFRRYALTQADPEDVLRRMARIGRFESAPDGNAPDIEDRFEAIP